MLAKKKLKPGQNGTKAMLDQYGEQLVCVRYRYDRARQLRLKTVELIVETAPWIHPADQIAPAAIVGIRVALAEADLQRQVKQAGGKWNRERRLWDIRYDQVVALNLTERIEPSTMPNNGKVAHA
ncbi:MAG: hypothetical protein HYR56_28905 [Acidobacteria bacterium]|nr:hypothetical protein [Acidobacteriota bacterium]MBI3423994.1 hypothetical protein [Acidobacteriota bacterium]